MVFAVVVGRVGSVRADFSARVVNDVLVGRHPRFCPTGIFEVF